jgi:hypothetical protein
VNGISGPGIFRDVRGGGEYVHPVCPRVFPSARKVLSIGEVFVSRTAVYFRYNCREWDDAKRAISRSTAVND